MSDVNVVVKLVPNVAATFPFLSIVNILFPDLDAVNISPDANELSTTKAAKGVEPETEATARVLILDLISTPASGVAAFNPIFPVPFGAIFRFAFEVVVNNGDIKDVVPNNDVPWNEPLVTRFEPVAFMRVIPP